MSGDKGVEVNSEERTTYTEYLLESVQNLSLCFNEHSNRCRYSPHIVNLSLTLYLRNKQSHDQVRKVGFIKLPHPSTLKNITRRIKFGPVLDRHLSNHSRVCSPITKSYRGPFDVRQD